MNLNFTLVIQILSFLALLGLLTKFLYKPLVKYLDERREDIRKLIEGTEMDRKKAEDYLESAKRELQETREKALSLKESVARETDKERIKTIDQAKREALSIIERAELDIKKEIERAKKEIKKDVASLAINVAKKILNREISEKDHQELIKQSIKEIEK